jgi:hypothetical protein
MHSRPAIISQITEDALPEPQDPSDSQKLKANDDAGLVHSATERSPEPQKSNLTPILSLILSIAAFLISTLSFMYQYIPHDNISYILTAPNVATLDPEQDHPRIIYIRTTLSIFNKGNMAASLISAEAFMIERDQESKATANTVCDETHNVRRALPPIEYISSSYPYRSYTGVVEQGKILSLPMMFALRRGKEIDTGKQFSELICFRMAVADSRGTVYTVTNPLVKLSIRLEEDDSHFFSHLKF